MCNLVWHKAAIEWTPSWIQTLCSSNKQYAYTENQYIPKQKKKNNK